MLNPLHLGNEARGSLSEPGQRLNETPNRDRTRVKNPIAPGWIVEPVTGIAIPGRVDI